MSINLCLDLNPADLQFLAKAVHAIQVAAKGREADEIIRGARRIITVMRESKLPPFIAERLSSVETLVDMVEDANFELPRHDLQRVLAALAYLVDRHGGVPADRPALALLDDAIPFELCRHDLQFSIAAYDRFREWRELQAQRRGVDPATLKVHRSEWAEARAIELIDAMHRERSASHDSGKWTPVLFKVT